MANGYLGYKLIMEKLGGKGWINLTFLNNLLSHFNIEQIGYGQRHNRTDGEANIFYKDFVGNTFELKNANYYAADSFKPLIDWILSDDRS